MTDDIEAARDVLTEAAETAEATLANPTVDWNSGRGGACDKAYWEKRAAANRLGLVALDALARERQEDAEDEADAIAALDEPGPSIPYEQVRRELGLDDDPSDVAPEGSFERTRDMLDGTTVRELCERISDLEARMKAARGACGRIFEGQRVTDLANDVMDALDGK